jgi:O-antigen/teichoic acid export membrane protein
MSHVIGGPAPGAYAPPPPRRPTGEVPTRADAGGSRKYMRGSTLLLGGRFISLALNLAVQILIVRYLSKNDYGAFAYGIGVASIGASLVLMGLDKSTARFVPIYQERGEIRKAFGAIALAVGLVTALGLSVVALCYGLRGLLAGGMIEDPLALSVLLILIALAPVDALDSLLQGQLAIFVGPRAIFFRRHVLGPGLKLATVLLVIFTAGDVHLLAWGYLTGGILGLSTYVILLGRAWKKQGVLRYAAPRSIEVPAREILGYSFPLLSSELILILRGSFTVVLLEALHSTTSVADYRAVLPFAKLNLVVLQSFSYMFIPLASRMFARSDREGINSLYWNTALWVSVFSFPVFALTFSLAGPVTLLLFGPEYAGAAAVLALLALGHYFHAAVGFNQYVLRVQGHVRYIVATDLAAAAIGLALNLYLIPRHGALGAAVGTAVTFVLHNLLTHAGLLVCDTGIRLLVWRYVGVYLLIALLSSGLLIAQWLLNPSVYWGFALVALASIVLIRTTRHLVRLEETFPELLRIPLLRTLLT